VSELHFLDTGYVLALELANDQNHGAAARHWHGFLLQQPRLVTTSFVFDETVTFFNAHGHHAKAVEVGSNLLDSPSIQLIHVDRRLFDAGWNLLKRHHDKRYSLTDCISFVVMGELSIGRALTFDRHFAQAGFEVLPSRKRG